MPHRNVAFAVLLAFAAVSLWAPPSIAATAAPGDTSTTVTLFDDFSADTPGLAPNLAIPGAPAGDFLTLNETSGTVRVNAMIDGLTMAAQLKQSNGIGGVALFGWPAAPPPGTERITVGWRSVAQDDNPITIVACTVRGSNGALVASIEYLGHGALTWNGLAGAPETIPVEYRQNRNNAFVLTVDLLAKTVSLSIDGVALAGFQNRAFAEATTDVARIGFEAGGTAPQTFAADDLFAAAFSRAPDFGPVVSAPALVNGAEGSPIAFSVTAADPDGDAIASLTAAPLPTGAGFLANASNTAGDFAWTPDFTQSGDYSIVFTAQNAVAGTATTAIAVSGTDRAPVVDTPASAAGEERGHVSFTASASDPDADVIAPLTANLSALPAGHTATFTPNTGDDTGVFEWSPALGSAGVYPIAITATAGSLTGEATTTVYVAALGTSTVGRFIWTPNDADVGGSWSVTFIGTNPQNESTSLVVPLTVEAAEGALANPTPNPAAVSPRTRALAPQAPQKGPIVEATGSRNGRSGETLTLTATATSDLSGLAGRFTPFRAGEVSSAASRAASITLTADLSGLPAINDAEFIIDQDPVVNVPLPVSGNVGFPVNVHVGAADPDGDPIETFSPDLSTLPVGNDATFTLNGTNTLGTLTWTPTVSDSGTFFVTFTATNRLVGQNTAEIRIRGVSAARIFQTGGNKKISLASGKPATCVQIEPIDASFDLANVDFRSIAMISEGTGTVSRILASAGKTSFVGDRDGNLIEDMTACFAKADLRLLFSLLRGSNSVPVAIEGNLIAGGRFQGAVTLEVNAGGGKLAAAVYPNPLNPRGVLGFTTTKPGFARVRIFDLNGRMVRQVLDAPALEPGYHEVAIDGADAGGRPLASGVYFFRVESREGSSQGRLAVVK